jgi:hypothetical protein
VDRELAHRSATLLSANSSIPIRAPPRVGRWTRAGVYTPSTKLQTPPGCGQSDLHLAAPAHVQRQTLRRHNQHQLPRNQARPPVSCHRALKDLSQ